MEMIEGVEPDYILQARRLAAALRQLRLAAGLSTYDLAQSLGWSQAKVAKLEHGRTPVTAVVVQAWSDAVTAALQATIQRVDQAQAELVAAIPWRHPAIPSRPDPDPDRAGR